MQNKQALLEQARRLAPELAARAAETEARRSPPDETIRALEASGILSTLVPRRWGGCELGLDTHVEIVEILSAACMSTGWVAAFYMGHNWMIVKFPERTQAEVFKDRPYAMIPATTSPTLKARQVSGGWVVDGRAHWGSGITHADWVMMAGRTEQGPRQFLMPASSVRIDDVWRMSGMAGTGSNDYIAEEVFVPDHRTMPAPQFAGGATAGTALHGNPLYEIPVLPFIYVESLPVLTGGLRGAVRAFDETVQQRVTTHTQSVQREQPQSHIHLGDAHASAIVAESLMREQIRLTEQMLRERAFTTANRAELKLRAGFVVDHCRRAVNDLAHRAGSSNFHADRPLQRFFRDTNLLATHAFWDWDVCREQYGRVRVGLQPNTPLI